MSTTLTLEPTEKKANHRANIVLITEAARRAHPDPETTDLELIDIPNTGFQVVVRKGQFLNGDLGVYIQPDSVIPQTEPFRFIWEGHVGLDGTVPEKHRRITVRKFRKQYSEGLLLPITDFPELSSMKGDLQAGHNGGVYDIHEGSDVSTELGITHYNPDSGTESTKADQGNAPKRKFKYPRTIRGWFNFIKRFLSRDGSFAQATVDVPIPVPTYDIEGFKNYKNTFEPGEEVIVTEKIHGSNARFLYLEGTQYVGSRNQWKAPGSNSLWHRALKDNEWIEKWCREHEGVVLYGEIAPTQKGFTYGAKDEIKFFAFDMLGANGVWWGWDRFIGEVGSGRTTSVIVPLLYVGPYYDGLLEKMAQGPSWVYGAGHIREGCVAKTRVERHVRGLGRAQLKYVSSAFLEKDSK
jgi:hypothetical protein